MNNNFDDLEFIDLDDLDNNSTPISGTSNQVDYNALINEEVNPDSINMSFVDQSFAQSDEEEDNFIARSFERSQHNDSQDGDYSYVEDDEEDVAVARRRRRAAKERAERRRKKKQQVMIRRAVFATALIAFIVSGFFLAKALLGYARGDKIYDDIQGQIFLETPDTPKPGNSNTTTPSAGAVSSPEDVLLKNYDHQALIKLNEDAVGYLQIPAIDIVLPVVQGNDNDYYLSHTLTGESNKSGTLFIDSRDTAGIESQNTIVYGHNMKNGSMFGQLDKFMDSEFFQTGYNKYFYFYIGDKIYKYEIYSVHTTPAISDTYSIIFPTGDSFIGYYNNMVKMSYHKTELTVTAASKTMTLSTCTNDDKIRLVVQAVRVEELAANSN